MKKLALSVVALMVAGAAMSVSAAGCSSSSSAGTTEDSGTGEDVTTGDSGEMSETSTDDSATPTDSGTGGETAAACDVDAAGSLQIGVDTDAGFVENTPCETCIATNCAIPQCQCLTDTNVVQVDDAGEPGCGAYAGCVYTQFLTNLALSDAGAAGEGADLTAAQATCMGSFAAGSISTGNALIGCIASSCSSSCVQ